MKISISEIEQILVEAKKFQSKYRELGDIIILELCDGGRIDVSVELSDKSDSYNMDMAIASK